MISCRALYTIAAFLGPIIGSATFLQLLPERGAIVAMAFVAGYVAAIGVYCHYQEGPGPGPPAGS